MTDLGAVKQFLGLEIDRDRTQKTITIRQSRRINDILERTQMTDFYRLRIGQLSSIPCAD